MNTTLNIEKKNLLFCSELKQKKNKKHLVLNLRYDMKLLNIYFLYYRFHSHDLWLRVNFYTMCWFKTDFFTLTFKNRP